MAIGCRSFLGMLVTDVRVDCRSKRAPTLITDQLT